MLYVANVENLTGKMVAASDKTSVPGLTRRHSPVTRVEKYETLWNRVRGCKPDGNSERVLEGSQADRSGGMKRDVKTDDSKAGASDMMGK